METKYLIFKEVPFEGKTKRFEILSKSNNVLLAKIQWYPAWRQYVFTPAYPTIWNIDCLKDIENFLHMLKEERKCKPLS